MKASPSYLEKRYLLENFVKCCNITYNHVENDGSYAIERDEDTLKIYFEPSNGSLDWKHNFLFPAKPYRDMENIWFCHRGFLKVWKSIKPYIKDSILDPTVQKVEIIGYSHGGAIAQLCYEYVCFNRPDVALQGYGFGAPRVFWGFIKKPVRERFKGFYVVRNGNDLVTHVPPAILGFRHISPIITVGKHRSLIKDHCPEYYIDGLQGNKNYEV